MTPHAEAMARETLLHAGPRLRRLPSLGRPSPRRPHGGDEVDLRADQLDEAAVAYVIAHGINLARSKADG